MPAAKCVRQENSPKSNFDICNMRKGPKLRNKEGNAILADPRTHRYYIALNDEENERFLSMMRQTQYRRAADFIRARLFD